MGVKFSPPSDSIYFNKITTGNANAGNGGNGTNYGNISNNPTLKFDPTNKAYGASVDVNTGDHVHQKAYWDAGGAIAGDPPSGGVNATATSNGSQSSWSGMIPLMCMPIHTRTKRTSSGWTSPSRPLPALEDTAETAIRLRVAPSRSSR